MVTFFAFVVVALIPQESVERSSTSTVSDAFTIPTSSTSRAEQIVVVGTRSGESLLNLPYAAAVLDERDIIGARPTLELGEVLSQVPGVFVTSRSNYAQDTRISVRGFGARSSFGVRGLRLVLDGMPLTLPDGQSQLDSIDVAQIGRLEVLRGPAGSLYGNAAGGVLYLTSRTPQAPLEARVRMHVGGFGTNKLLASVSKSIGDGGHVGAFFSRTEVDAWRNQSAAEQYVAQATVAMPLGKIGAWSAAVHFIDAPKAEDPGGLTLEQYRTSPREAAEVNENFRTGEEVSQLQAGSRLRLTWSEHHETELSAHVGMRDFLASVPFRTVDFARDFFGGLIIHRWTENEWLAGHRLSFGVEVQGQEDRRGNQGNNAGRQDGEASLLQVESVSNLAVFAQEKLSPVGNLTILGSVRYDRVVFDVQDDLLGDGDASGRRRFEQFTGRGGVVFGFSEAISLFGNVSQSFETPTTTELVASAPNGGLSGELNAQKALSFEAGFRGRYRWISYDFAGFFIDLTDEIVTAENEFGQRVFNNAGVSERTGVEISLRARPLSSVEVVTAYTWLRAEYGDGERNGNQLPGLPRHRFFSRAQYDNGYLFVTGELEWVGRRFADDTNLVSAPAHTLVELRFGGRAPLGAGLRGILSAGIRNALDIQYIDNIRPNAFGARYFEPGTPLTVFANLGISYAKDN